MATHLFCTQKLVGFDSPRVHFIFMINLIVGSLMFCLSAIEFKKASGSRSKYDAFWGGVYLALGIANIALLVQKL